MAGMGSGKEQHAQNETGEDGGGGRLDDGDYFERGLYHDTFVLGNQFNE